MNVVLRPELRTSGGECLGIFLEHRWVGDVYLVYRENHLLTGTIQLDAGKLAEDQMEPVVRHVQEYISGVAGALNIDDATIVMMYGDVDPVLEGPETAVQSRSHDVHSAASAGDGPEDEQYGDEGPEHEMDESGDVYQMSPLREDRRGTTTAPQGEKPFRLKRRRRRGSTGRRISLHLSLHREEGSHTKYHLHDDRHHTIGLVAVDELDNSVSGRVDFWRPPGKALTNEVARLLAKEFADGEVDRVSFTMNYRDQHVGDMHLEKQQIH